MYISICTPNHSSVVQVEAHTLLTADEETNVEIGAVLYCILCECSKQSKQEQLAIIEIEGLAALE